MPSGDRFRKQIAGKAVDISAVQVAVLLEGTKTVKYLKDKYGSRVTQTIKALENGEYLVSDGRKVSRTDSGTLVAKAAKQTGWTI